MIFTVAAVLKKHYEGLCNSLPHDFTVTLKRIRKCATVSEGLESRLALLPSDHANAMIIGLLIRPLPDDVGVLSFCDIMEKVVDSDASREFINNVRFGKYIN